ncbi:MAG: hypothetical protein HY712_02020 [candidate division NC10 bacterium]|nr:hypothetical protein [candidate division NC10 bacterium]
MRDPSALSIRIAGWTAVAGGLFVASLYRYVLFPSLVETFTIVVAFAIILLAWNARRFLDNNYLLFLGITYAFVAVVDMLHTFRRPAGKPESTVGWGSSAWRSRRHSSGDA